MYTLKRLSLLMTIGSAVAALAAGCGDSDAGSGSGGSGGGDSALAADVPPAAADATPSPEPSQDKDQKPACAANSNPLFTSDITDLGLVDLITPLGAPAGNEIKSHTYIKNLADMPDPRGVPVYAPVDSALTSIAYYVSGPRNEYLLIFEVSCEVTYRFDHVQIVVDSIKKVAPDKPANDSQTQDVSPSVSFKAGELIGYTRGTDGARTWDFGVYNTTKTNQFGDNKRYEARGWTNNLNSDCPYDYFSKASRDQYYSMFGLPGGPRIPNSTCRSASRDKAGTAAGGWFLDSGTKETAA